MRTRHTMNNFRDISSLPNMHPARAATQQRGIAMLLVLISLATATIITMAYLSSRDNSAQIGQNIGATASARWAAVAGLEMGVAIMETNTDWRNNHSGGVLLAAYPIGAAVVDIEVKDMETNAPPTDDSTHLRLTATSIVNGVTQIATAAATAINPKTMQTVNVDFGEFAVFASDQLIMEDQATIGRWAESPRNQLGARLNLGVASGDAGTVDLRNNAKLIDASLYVGPGSSGMVALTATEQSLQIEELGDWMPTPLPPTPMNPPGGAEFIRNNVSESLAVDTHVGQAHLTNFSEVKLLGPMTFTVDGDLRIESNAVIRVQGDVTIVLDDGLIMNNSAIELEPNSTLRLFIEDELSMHDSYIGYDRGGLNTLDNTGHATYMDSRRIMIYGSNTTSTHELKGRSVLMGSIYNMTGAFIASDKASTYGRVAASTVLLGDTSALFYDPVLDRYAGYTNPRSRLYKEDGTLHDAVKTLASLNDADLAALETSLGTTVIKTADTLLNIAGSLITYDAPEPAQPTPRSMPVRFSLTSIGFDRHEIER